MSNTAVGVPLSAEERPDVERLATIIGYVADDEEARPAIGLPSLAHRIAARLISEYGVSVPTEPGAPDPLRRWVESLLRHAERDGLVWVTKDEVRNVLASRPVPAPEPSARLDEAWAAAEAAMPKGWCFSISPYWPSGWEAEAHDISLVYEPGRGKHGTGTTGSYDTPAEALDALRAALAATPQDPEEETR